MTKKFHYQISGNVNRANISDCSLNEFLNPKLFCGMTELYCLLETKDMVVDKKLH